MNSTHPDSLLPCALSREGQDILFELDYMDSHLVAGSRTARDVDTLRAGGAKIEIFDIERFQSRDETELAGVLPDVQRILSKK